VKKKNICPVCGFDGLKEPAFGPHNEPSYEICPRCGFEPGYNAGNDAAIIKKLRQCWMENGKLD
jgi:ribosomal protein L37E